MLQRADDFIIERLCRPLSTWSYARSGRGHMTWAYELLRISVILGILNAAYMVGYGWEMAGYSAMTVLMWTLIYVRDRNHILLQGETNQLAELVRREEYRVRCVLMCVGAVFLTVDVIRVALGWFNAVGASVDAAGAMWVVHHHFRAAGTAPPAPKEPEKEALPAGLVTGGA